MFKVSLNVITLASFISNMRTPLPVSVIPPPPEVIERVLLLLLLKSPVESVLPLRFRVPLVRVSVRVLPIVRLSASCTVAPGALMVMGKSRVLPLVVIDWVPEVAAKVVMPVPALTDSPVEIVKLP